MEILNGYQSLQNSESSRRPENVPEQTPFAVPIEVCNDFRRTVSLMCLLGRIKGARKVSDTFQGDGNSLETRWKKFLDNMALLADRESAGESTTSIASRMNSEIFEPMSIKYLISSNKAILPKTVCHMTGVLSKLKQMSQLHDKEQYIEQEMELSRACIDFSSKKAGSYLRRLARTIEHMEARMKDFSDLGRSLLQHLSNLFASEDNLSQSCSIAYGLRSSTLLSNLDQIIESRHSDVGWKVIRHFIGRLASWHRSIKILVYLLRREPLFMANFEFEAVPYTPIAKQGISKASAKDLDNALQRQCPDASLRKRRELLTDRLKRFYSSIDEAFACNYQNQVKVKTTAHTEVVMLDKISKEDDFKFAFGVRYIGCSKPCCYLCDLYMEHHPLGLHHRPCHGNIYSNWCWPSGTHDEVEVLEKMVNSMRQEFESQISIDVSELESVFDSITGLSASIVS